MKYINNTGSVLLKGSDVAEKAECFAHYTYVESGKKLVVLDIQGTGCKLYDPEIATEQLFDEHDNSIYFCSGNLSQTAIDTFMTEHVCNKYCDMLDLK